MLPGLNEGLSDITLSLADCGYFGFIAPKTLNYLAFRSFNFERT